MASVLFWAVIHCVAFAAGGPVGTAVVIAVWVVVSYLPGKKAQNQGEARLFSWSEQPASDIYVSNQVDFEEMTLQTKVSTPGSPDERETYLLHRASGGWQMRMDEATHRAALQRRKTQRFRDERATERERKNEWQPLDGHDASKIEVAYQRYLRTL